MSKFAIAFLCGSLGAITSALAQCPVAFAPAVAYPVGGNPQFVALGDVNGDGPIDLVVTTSDTNSLSILLGNGSGTFQAAMNRAAGPNPLGVVTGDFNGDGRCDFGLSLGGVAPGYAGAVTTWLGTGNSAFQPPINYVAGANTGHVLAADLNHDGILDLVAVNGISGTVSVLLGIGDGTFQNATNYPTGQSPGTVAVGDFNEDGKIDLAVANYVAAGSVSVLLGNGDGTFQTALAYTAGSVNTGSVAVGDFNGDGHLDLVTTNREGHNGSVLLGNGNGTFQSPTIYAAGSDPVWVAVGDLNGDGKADLAIANFIPNILAIRLGNGDGTFQSTSNISIGNPPKVAIADLNGDGKPDLVVPNGQFRNTVSVLLNTSSPGFAAATIVQQPGACRAVRVGQGLALSVVADGHGNALTYQWRKSGVALSDGGNLAGASTAVLTISPANPSDAAVYDVRVSVPGCAGGVVTTTSSEVVLTVIGGSACAPVISQQPVSQSAVNTTSANFSVAASSPAGGGAVTYRWRRNGVALTDAPTGWGSVITGVTTPTLTISYCTLTDNGGAFDCVVSNTCGSTTSSPAGLAVTARCPADFNGNGGVTVQDIFAFLTAWFAGCP